MADQTLLTSMVLGLGGNRPGVGLFSDGSACYHRVLNLPAGHSVYALDVDADQGLLAAGTRAGPIHVLRWSEGCEDVLSSFNLHQHASIISLCLMASGRMVSVDTTGVCLVWDLHDGLGAPRVCDTSGELIGALLALPDDRLAGLTAQGHVVFWDRSLTHFERVVAGPRPASKLALVRLHYWPSQNAIVYPATQGHLALCRLEEHELFVWDAHDGDFYAIFVEEEALCTIGCCDGMAKMWKKPGSGPTHQAKVPHGVIAAAGFDGASGRALLIHDRFAAVYDLRSDPVKQTARLSSGSYRSVARHARKAWRAVSRDQRAHADELQARIQEKMQANESEGLELLHDQLIALGFESVSLALRAQQAAREQNPIEELRLRRRLDRLLPPQDSRSLPALRRYLEILEAFWLTAEAREVCSRIPPEELADPTAPTWLEQASGIMEGDDWVAASTSLPELIQAAGELDRPFAGRWAIAELEHFRFTYPNQVLTAESLAEKYEQIRQEQRRSDLPPARAGQFWWLSRGTAVPAELAVFGEPSERFSPSLRHAAQVGNRMGECSVVIWGLLDAGRPHSGESWEAHNRQVLAMLQQSQQSGSAGGWPRPLRETVAAALLRLQNLACSHGAHREEW